MHIATSSAPDIDRVIDETWRTLFTNRIASIMLHEWKRSSSQNILGTPTQKPTFELSCSPYPGNTSTTTKKKPIIAFFAENLPDLPYNDLQVSRGTLLTTSPNSCRPS